MESIPIVIINSVVLLTTNGFWPHVRAPVFLGSLTRQINDLQRKPRENSSLAKNPPKYSTSNIVFNATAGGTVNLNVSQVMLKQ